MVVNLTRFLSGQYDPSEILNNTFLGGVLATTATTPTGSAANNPPSVTSDRAQDIAGDVERLEGTARPQSPTSAASLTPSTSDASGFFDIEDALEEDDEVDQSDINERRRAELTDAQIRFFEEMAENNNVSSNEMFLKSIWDFGTVERDPDEAFGGLRTDIPIEEQLQKQAEVLPGGREPAPGQYLSRVEAVAEYSETDPNTRAQLQALLFQSGYVNEPPIAGPGSLSDSRYRNAWSDAVKHAAASGMGILPYLRQEAQRAQEAGFGTGSGSGTSGPKRPTVQLISDEDADELIEETARQTIGRVLTDDEKEVVKKMTESIRDTQRVEQNRLIDQRMAGGGEAEDPTAVSTLAEQEVETEFETETTGYRVASAFADVARLIGGG